MITGSVSCRCNWGLFVRVLSGNANGDDGCGAKVQFSHCVSPRLIRTLYWKKKEGGKWVVLLSCPQRSYLMWARKLCVWTRNYEAERRSLHSEISWTDVHSHSWRANALYSVKWAMDTLQHAAWLWSSHKDREKKTLVCQGTGVPLCAFILTVYYDCISWLWPSYPTYLMTEVMR